MKLTREAAKHGLDLLWGSWKEFFLLNLGTIILTVGVYFFKFPNHFTTGGVSGISIVINAIFPALTMGTVNLILNLVLLVIGWIILGASFGVRTAYASIVYSLLTVLLEKLAPLSAPLTNEAFVELIFAVGLPALGSAILFSVTASSGGTDVLAMLLNKFTSLDIGTALICTDFVVAASACLVYDIRTGLFSILGLIIKALLVNQVSDNLRAYKIFQIVTTKPESICDFIIRDLHHSATLMNAEGYYTHQDSKVVMTVVNRSQALRLQHFVRTEDPHSFITITTTSQIIGKGFSGMSE